ncbi:hypothetical protein [Alkalicoccus luteus]|uniref:Uncharacterized protein n=1 Tax=Alkalicoccus luteus TaxID=1237094 RepID=A0A969TYK7_9BACI|nr:hypothetical protein [Alkalicoccus luteus]NJP39264.1 hypothetical protein [Alkalicoccus luteus]
MMETKPKSVKTLVKETFQQMEQPGTWLPAFVALIVVTLPVWIFLLVSNQPIFLGEGRQFSFGELMQTGGANEHPYRAGGGALTLLEQIIHFVLLPGIYAFLILRLLFPAKESKQLWKTSGKRILPLLIANLILGIVAFVVLMVPLVLGMAGGPFVSLMMLVFALILLAALLIRLSFFFALITVSGETPHFSPAWHLMTGHTGKAFLFLLALGVPGFALVFGIELVILSILGYSVAAEIIATLLNFLFWIVLLTGYTMLFRNIYTWEEEKEPELAT